jgi:hypothetical protein
MGEHAVVPPARQGEPKMTSHLATLVKRVFGCAIAPRNSLFSRFTPLACRRDWLMTARGLLIQGASLLLVRCSIFTSGFDDRLI